MGVKLKDTTKAESTRKEGFIISVASKEHAGDLLRGGVSLNSKVGKFSLRIHEYSWRGFDGVCTFMKGLVQRRIQHRIGARVHRIQALIV